MLTFNFVLSFLLSVRIWFVHLHWCLEKKSSHLCQVSNQRLFSIEVVVSPSLHSFHPFIRNRNHQTDTHTLRVFLTTLIISCLVQSLMTCKAPVGRLEVYFSRSLMTLVVSSGCCLDTRAVEVALTVREMKWPVLMAIGRQASKPPGPNLTSVNSFLINMKNVISSQNHPLLLSDKIRHKQSSESFAESRIQNPMITAMSWKCCIG